VTRLLEFVFRIRVALHLTRGGVAWDGPGGVALAPIRHPDQPTNASTPPTPGRRV
jgi:hypothetical protein